MAGARQAILEAFDRLERRTGQKAHPLKTIVAEVLSHDQSFKEATIRTYVVSVMCSDSPVHHANHSNDLRRLDRGLYARVFEGAIPALPRKEAQPPPGSTIPPPEPHTDAASEWYWEGRVQAAIVSGLVRLGWEIRAVSDTASRAQGTDVVATKGGQRIHVEVKGYPAAVYARGPSVGERKPTHPATQARVWFAGALLKAAMLRGDYPDDMVVMGLPAFETYRNLSDRVSLTLDRADIGIIWVSEGGQVSFEPPTPH